MSINRIDRLSADQAENVEKIVVPPTDEVLVVDDRFALQLVRVRNKNRLLIVSERELLVMHEEERAKREVGLRLGETDAGRIGSRVFHLRSSHIDSRVLIGTNYDLSFLGKNRSGFYFDLISTQPATVIKYEPQDPRALMSRIRMLGR